MPGLWRLRLNMEWCFCRSQRELLQEGVVREAEAGVGKFRCKTCKLVLRTLVVSTLIHIVH